MYDCLQSRTSVPQIGPSLCSDMCPAPSHDGNQYITVKVEEDLEAEVGEDLEPMSFTEMKAEIEVCCVSVF